MPLLCHLAQVRAVIDAVASDESLSRSDRSRIVDLLRKVEQALVDIKINGALPVQEAAAAAGVIVGLSFWELVRSRPWARHFVVVVAAPFAALEATANTRGHRAVLLGSAAERRSDPVERRRYDFTDLPVFDAFDAIALFPRPAAPSRSHPRSSGAVGALAELPTTAIGPTGIAVTLALLGAQLVLVTTVTLALLKPLGPDPIPTPPTAAISCFVSLRRGRQLVYERNMIDELALRLVHGQLPVGS